MAAGVAVATLALTPPAAAITLTKAVEKAIATHPELLRDKSLDLAAEQQIDQAFSRFLPTFDLEGSTGYEYTNSPSTRGRNGAGRNQPEYRQLWRTDTSVVGRQLAFDGFGALNQLRLARNESRAASSLVYDTAERVGVRVVQAYLDILRTQEFVRIAEESAKEHQVILTQITDLAQAGRGLGSDVDQAQSRLALAQSGLEQRRGELRQAQARYTETVGEPPENLVRPSEPQFQMPQDMEVAVKVAVANHPAIRITTANYHARLKEIKTIKARFYPRLELEAFGSFNDNQDGVLGPDADLNARLRMRYNILNGLGDLAAKRGSRERATAALEDDRERRRQVREEVRVAYQEVITARERLGFLAEHEAAEERVLTGYRGQFELGRRSLLDLLDAQNELFQARLGLTDGDYRVLLSQFELMFTLGSLLQHLNVAVSAVHGRGTLE